MPNDQCPIRLLGFPIALLPAGSKKRAFHGYPDELDLVVVLREWPGAFRGGLAGGGRGFFVNGFAFERLGGILGGARRRRDVAQDDLDLARLAVVQNKGDGGLDQRPIIGLFVAPLIAGVADARLWTA